MRPRYSTLVCSLLFALTLPALAAATPFTATYDFTGAPGNQPSQAVVLNPLGATFADITRGPGLNPVIGTDSINSSGWDANFDTSNFYRFIVTPDAGYQMDLTSLDFSERRSAAGIMTFEVRTSVNLWATSIYTFTTPSNLEVRRHSVALGAAFQDLTGPVDFRFFAYDAAAAAGTWRLGSSIAAGDNPNGFAPNLQVAGDLTAVPEPATLLLLSAGLGGIVRLRRRLQR